MRRRAIAFLLLAVLLATLPMAALAANTKYVKTSSGSNVRVRRGPGTDYEIIDHVSYGGKVEVLDTYGTWSEVYYNGQYGYISSKYLVDKKPASNSTNPKNYQEELSTGIYNNFRDVGYYTQVKPSTPGNFVNMRWAPSQDSPVVEKCYADKTLYIVAENNSWYQVYDVDTGDAGFMLKSLTWKY